MKVMFVSIMLCRLWFLLMLVFFVCEINNWFFFGFVGGVFLLVI